MSATIETLAQELQEISAQVKVLEAEHSLFKRALQRLLGDDDQAYYWTPHWQQMEAIADEEYRQGYFDTFEDGEALIEHIQTLIVEPETA